MHRRRYHVRDLSPRDRSALRIAACRIRYVFLAESPHKDEVTDPIARKRMPLVGDAGKRFWREIGTALGIVIDPDDPQQILQVCRKYGIAVINAVQFPIGYTIIRSHWQANPLRLLGFSKPPRSKKLKAYLSGKAYCSPAKRAKVQPVLKSLRKRLTDPALASARVYCLGGDARWFTRRVWQAGMPPIDDTVIPHPAVWFNPKHAAKGKTDLARILKGALLPVGSGEPIGQRIGGP